MSSAMAIHHLQQAVRHLREAAASVHRQHPELTAILWQYAESLSDYDLETRVFSFTLMDEFTLEVGSDTRHTFEGPLWFSIVVAPRID